MLCADFGKLLLGYKFVHYKQMKFKHLTVWLILLLVSTLFLSCFLPAKAVTTQTSPSLYVGVDVAFGSIAATEQLIDNVSSYTNFFVIGCTGGYNETRLTIISQYVYSKGLSFIVYTDNPRYPTSQWFEDAENNWGNSFLGIYYYDEPGGKQLDQSDNPLVQSADNYSDAADQYVNITSLLFRGPYSITQNFAYPTEYPLFISDYALYWYDYEAGYDTVFAEFGWNYSRQLNVALDRGAATVMNKDWGVMITWTYTQPPYMESGPQLYNDMVLAYENGAKYIIVFDSNENYTQSVLQQGQLDAMNQFWQYVQANPRIIGPVSDRTAYVLPADYAYGFRGPDDKIWGLWGPDSITNSICMNVSLLLQKFGTNLDLVYPDGPQTVESVGYQNVINWNDSGLLSEILNTPSASPTLSPQTEQPTSSPGSQQNVSLLGVYLIAISGSIVVAVSVGTILLKFKKRSNSNLG